MKLLYYALAASLALVLASCHDSSGGSDGVPSSNVTQPGAGLTPTFNANANDQPTAVDSQTSTDLTDRFGGANGEPIRFAPGTSVQDIFASATP